MTPPAAPSPVWHNLFRRRPPWAEEVAGLWAATPLFEGIPRREVLRLARDMHPRSFEEDEVVFRAGDVGAGAVLVLEGRVEIRVGAARVAELRGGDFFGEVALVREERRTADAVSTAPTRAAFFLRVDLEEWIDRAPRLGARFVTNLAAVLAERLRVANARLGA